MKPIIIATILATLSGSVFAAEEKVISIEGKEVTYVSQSAQGEHGMVKLTPGVVFVGEKTVKDEHGVCSKETSRLISMETVKSMGMEIQVPTIEIRRLQIVCPS